LVYEKSETCGKLSPLGRDQFFLMSKTHVFLSLVFGPYIVVLSINYKEKGKK